MSRPTPYYVLTGPTLADSDFIRKARKLRTVRRAQQQVDR